MRTRDRSRLERGLLGGGRLGSRDAAQLWDAPLEWLGELAAARRAGRFGQQVFLIRNLHFEPTNVCLHGCQVCSFSRPPGRGGWEKGCEELRELLQAGGAGVRELHITGGVHPDRGLAFAEDLVRLARRTCPHLHIKAFTAAEIDFFTVRENLPVKAVLLRLQKAGLDSLAGGGAEIFSAPVRRQIAGNKLGAARWLEIHRAAHETGLPSNATMLFGHIETRAHRTDHLLRLRRLQDRYPGFQAFVPLRYRPWPGGLPGVSQAGREEVFRVFAMARILLDNIPHLKAYRPPLGDSLLLEAIRHGADDLDVTVAGDTRIFEAETKTRVRTGIKTGNDAAGRGVAGSYQELEILVRRAGFFPVERDGAYRPVQN